MRVRARSTIGVRPRTGLHPDPHDELARGGPEKAQEQHVHAHEEEEVGQGIGVEHHGGDRHGQPQSISSESGRRQKGATDPGPSAGSPREEPLM